MHFLSYFKNCKLEQESDPEVAHRFPQIFTDLYSQTGRLLCIMNYAL